MAKRRRKKSGLAKQASKAGKQIQRRAGKAGNKAAVHIVRKASGASAAQTLKNFKKNGWTGKQIEAATGVKPAQQRRIMEGKAGNKWDASLREARRMSRRPAPTGNQAPPTMTRAGQQMTREAAARAKQRQGRAAGEKTKQQTKTVGAQHKPRATSKPTKPTRQQRRAAEIERRAAAQRTTLITGLAKRARAGGAADELIAQIPDASTAERNRIHREAKIHAREMAQKQRDAERIRAKQAREARRAQVTAHTTALRRGEQPDPATLGELTAAEQKRIDAARQARQDKLERDAQKQAERDAKAQKQAELKAEKDREREAKKQAAEQAKQDRAREREGRRELLNEAIGDIKNGEVHASRIAEIGGQPLTAQEQKRLDAAQRAHDTLEAKARAREEIRTDITADDPDEKQESQIEGGDDDDWGTEPLDNGLDDSDIPDGTETGKVPAKDDTPPAILKIKTITIG